MVEPTKTGTPKAQAYLIAMGIQALLLALFWSVDSVVLWVLTGGIFFTGFLYFLSARKYDPNKFQFSQTSPSQAGSSPESFKTIPPEVKTKLIALGILVLVGLVFLVIIGLIIGEDLEPPIEEKSKQELLEKINDDPTNIDALTTLGNQYFEATQFDSALICYEKVLTIEAQNSSALYNKALVYYRQRNHEASITAFKQYIQLYPEVGAAHYMVGMNYYERQLYDASFEWFKKAYELGERDPFLFHALAWLYDTRQDLTKAIPLYKETLQLDSTRADIYLRLAELEPERVTAYKKLYEKWQPQ
jgi:tetratricopeptide (TPR) repeat protein